MGRAHAGTGVAAARGGARWLSANGRPAAAPACAGGVPWAVPSCACSVPATAPPLHRAASQRARARRSGRRMSSAPRYRRRVLLFDGGGVLPSAELHQEQRPDERARPTRPQPLGGRRVPRARRGRRWRAERAAAAGTLGKPNPGERGLPGILATAPRPPSRAPTTPARAAPPRVAPPLVRVRTACTDAPSDGQYSL